MDRSKEKINVVIAEDNINFCEILQTFIEPLNKFNVIGVANDGHELIELNYLLKPDLLLVDIRMPKLNGTDAYKECLKTNPNVKAIFITAYDQFAVEAFDLHVVDYLVKPIEKKRLYLALDRAETIIMKEIKQEHYEKTAEQMSRLVIKYDRTIYVIPLTTILFIEKVNRKTYIHTKDNVFETYETLDTIKRSLDENFYACHRSYIINLSKVSKIKSDGETYFVYFHDYESYAHVSKWKMNELQNLLKTTQ